MEQKRPADIFQELLDYLWNGLGLSLIHISAGDHAEIWALF